MPDALSPYPAYKDSGVPWLGRIPAHWDATMAKRHYSIQLGKMLQNAPKSNDYKSIPYLKAQHVQWFAVRSHGLPHMWASPAEIEGYGVQVGDLLVCEGGEGGRSGLVKSIDGPTIIQNALHRVRPSSFCGNDFLQYVMSTVSAIGWFDALNNKATIAHFTREKFGVLGIPVPPTDEQHAITRYLDHIDRRIRRYIRAKQRLIALLEEQKRAVIHQAVTGQIDVRTGRPYPAYKPSGVEWLGNVPEHWEVVLNQRIFKEEIRSHGGQTETQLSLSQRDGLIATSEMQERSLQTSTYDNWKVVFPGDLVLNRFKAHLGVFFSSTLRGIVSFHYGVFAPRRPLVTKYYELLYHTNAYKTIYAGCSNGMTVGLQNLSNQNFYNVRSIVPPLDEQVEIVAYVVAATEHLNLAIRSVQREIALLREYRTRLIADVVTGQVDVRAAAAQLPAEVEEFDALDEAEAELVEDEEGESQVEEDGDA